MDPNGKEFVPDSYSRAFGEIDKYGRPTAKLTNQYRVDSYSRAFGEIDKYGRPTAKVTDQYRVDSYSRAFGEIDEDGQPTPKAIPRWKPDGSWFGPPPEELREAGYNPNEPRDYRGRWTTGGAGSGQPTTSGSDAATGNSGAPSLAPGLSPARSPLDHSPAPAFAQPRDEMFRPGRDHARIELLAMQTPADSGTAPPGAPAPAGTGSTTPARAAAAPTAANSPAGEASGKPLAGTPTPPSPAKPSQPANAPSSSQTPAIVKAANDPVVRGAAEHAWKDSNPYGSPNQRHEHGFWILRDDKTGVLSIQPYPAAGNGKNITPGPTPVVPGKTVIGTAHVHPNPPHENGINWTQGPSQDDRDFAENRHVPGIIRAHDGYHVYGPGVGADDVHIQNPAPAAGGAVHQPPTSNVKH